MKKVISLILTVAMLVTSLCISGFSANSGCVLSVEQYSLTNSELVVDLYVSDTSLDLTALRVSMEYTKGAVTLLSGKTMLDCTGTMSESASAYPHMSSFVLGTTAFSAEKTLVARYTFTIGENAKSYSTVAVSFKAVEAWSMDMLDVTSGVASGTFTLNTADIPEDSGSSVTPDTPVIPAEKIYINQNFESMESFTSQFVPGNFYIDDPGLLYGYDEARAIQSDYGQGSDGYFNNTGYSWLTYDTSVTFKIADDEVSAADRWVNLIYCNDNLPYYGRADGRVMMSFSYDVANGCFRFTEGWNNTSAEGQYMSPVYKTIDTDGLSFITLGMSVDKDRIRCFCNGELIFDLYDDTYLIAESIYSPFLMWQEGNFIQMSNIMVTEQGAIYPYPEDDDTTGAEKVTEFYFEEYSRTENELVVDLYSHDGTRAGITAFAFNMDYSDNVSLTKTETLYTNFTYTYSQSMTVKPYKIIGLSGTKNLPYTRVAISRFTFDISGLAIGEEMSIALSVDPKNGIYDTTFNDISGVVTLKEFKTEGGMGEVPPAVYITESSRDKGTLSVDVCLSDESEFGVNQLGFALGYSDNVTLKKCQYLYGEGTCVTADSVTDNPYKVTCSAGAGVYPGARTAIVRLTFDISKVTVDETVELTLSPSTNAPVMDADGNNLTSDTVFTGLSISDAGTVVPEPVPDNSTFYLKEISRGGSQLVLDLYSYDVKEYGITAFAFDVEYSANAVLMSCERLYTPFSFVFSPEITDTPYKIIGISGTEALPYDGIPLARLTFDVSAVKGGEDVTVSLNRDYESGIVDMNYGDVTDDVTVNGITVSDLVTLDGDIYIDENFESEEGFAADFTGDNFLVSDGVLIGYSDAVSIESLSKWNVFDAKMTFRMIDDFNSDRWVNLAYLSSGGYISFAYDVFEGCFRLTNGISTADASKALADPVYKAISTEAESEITLGISVSEGRIRCFFDGELIFDVDDNRIGTAAVPFCFRQVGNYIQVSNITVARCGFLFPNSDFKPGDVNGDGSINAIDCSYLVRLLTGVQIDVSGNSDVNGDGSINSIDMAMLNKITLGISTDAVSAARVGYASSVSKSAVSYAAASYPYYEAVISDGEYSAGDTVEVSVVVRNNIGLMSTSADSSVVYDNTVLKLVDIYSPIGELVYSDMATGNTIGSYSDFVNGNFPKTMMIFDVDPSYSEDGAIIVLGFEVLPTAAGDSTYIYGYNYDDGYEYDVTVPLNTDHTHSFEEQNVYPNCTESGTSKTVCGCGLVFDNGKIPAPGHTLSDDPAYNIEVPATCTSEGRTVSYCTVCGNTGKITVHEALGHYIQTRTVPVSCTVDGYTVEECLRDGCGYSGEKYNVVPKLSHKNPDGSDAWGEPHVGIKPTTNTTGYMSRTCVLCGADWNFEEIPVLAVKAGDTNMDGVINLLDVVVYVRYVNKWTGLYFSTDNAEVNGDGRVNIMDANVIIKYVTGWNVTFA